MNFQLLIIFITALLNLNFIQCTVRENCIKLVDAVESGNYELVESMLNNDVDSNQTVREFITYKYVPILWLAVKFRQVFIAKLLINNGAIVNFKRFGRWPEEFVTPLHMAILLSDNDMVELLLNSGADIYACDGLGYTPLEFAKSLGSNLYIIQLLEASIK